jgi:4-diphosphocytidyl-2-C-methyl-D-erythritol kinase
VAALSAPARNASGIRREARAKINAFLRVHGEREDGYHEIESLVLPISLADRVTVRTSAKLRVAVKGEDSLTGDVPVGGLNLALVAALALADECHDAGGALIEIDKRIPVAAGLGGGSADAAATIDALNELWGCGADAATVDALCERLGSDVPAMRAGTPVLISGRGERLEAAEVPQLHWVLVRFGFGVRSPDAYRWWDEDGGRTGPDPRPLLSAAAAGDPEALGPLLFNDLEASVVTRHPAVGRAKKRLLDLGAVGAVMSGSGASVVGLARDRGHAEEIAVGIDDAVAVAGPPPA